MKTYLEYKDESSNKFWQIEVEQNVQTIRYGKIGTNGRSKTDSFDNAAMALNDANSQIAKKQSKGYKIISDTRDELKENKSEVKSEENKSILSYNFSEKELDSMSNEERAKIGFDKVLEYYRKIYQEVPISDEDMAMFDTLLDDLYKSDEKLASVWYDGEISENPVYKKHVPTDKEEIKVFLTKMWLYIKKDTALNIEDIFTALGEREDEKVAYFMAKRNILGCIFNELTYLNPEFNEKQMIEICTAMASAFEDIQAVWNAIEKLDRLIPSPYDFDVKYRLADGINERTTNMFNYELLFYNFEESLNKKHIISDEFDTVLRRLFTIKFVYKNGYDIIAKHSPYLKDTLEPFDISLIEYAKKQDNPKIYDFIKMCMNATGAKPSKSFLKKYEQLLSELGEESFSQIALDISGIVRGFELKDFSEYEESEGEKFCRGLVFALMNVSNKKALDFVSYFMAQCYDRGQNTKLGNSCAYALSQMPQKMGLDALIKQKELVTSKKDINTLDKNIALIKDKDKPQTEEVQKVVAQIPQKPKEKMSKEQFFAKLANPTDAYCEWAGYRKIECKEEDLKRGRIYEDNPYVIYDERCKKDKTTRRICASDYSQHTGIDIEAATLHEPHKFGIDVNAKAISKKISSKDLLKRYEMISHMYAMSLVSNYDVKPEIDEPNENVCIDYYWEDFSKISKSFNTEMKHLKDNPHLALYWLIFMGLSLDERIEIVKEKISEHNLCEQLPDLKAGIEYFDSFDVKKAVPIYDEGDLQKALQKGVFSQKQIEIFQNISLIRHANLLFSLYLYDFRGGEGSFEKWWLSLTLHTKADKYSALRMHFFVKNLKEFNKWDELDEKLKQNPDISCLSYALTMHPKTSEEEKIKNADIFLNEMWENRYDFRMSHYFNFYSAFGWQAEETSFHDNIIMLTMIWELRYLFSDVKLVQKVAKFYFEYFNEDTLANQFLRDIANASKEKSGVDGAKIKKMTEKLVELARKGESAYKECEKYLSKFDEKTIFDLAQNFDNPTAPWRAGKIAYSLYSYILGLHVKGVSKILGELDSKYSPITCHRAELIRLSRTLIKDENDENINTIFELIELESGEWGEYLAYALAEFVDSKKVFDRVLEFIPSFEKSDMMEYKKSFKEEVLRNLFMPSKINSEDKSLVKKLSSLLKSSDDKPKHPMEKLSCEQMTKLLDVCLEKLKSDMVFTLLNLIYHSKDYENAQDWWVKNDFERWLKSTNLYTNEKRQELQQDEESCIMLRIPQREKPPKHWQDEKDWYGDFESIQKAHKGHRLVGGLLGANGFYLIAEKQYTNKFWTGSHRTQIYAYDYSTKQWHYHYYPDLNFHVCEVLNSNVSEDFFGVALGGSIITKKLDGEFKIKREHLPFWCPTGVKIFDDELHVSAYGGMLLKRTKDGEWQHLSQDFAQAYFEDKEGNKGFSCFDGFSPNEIYAGGEDGRVWLYKNGFWQAIKVPIRAVNYDPSHEDDADIDHIVCGSDGVVYIAGSCGILKGRGNTWEAAVNMQSHIKSMIWHKNALYFTANDFSSDSIYRLNPNGKLDKIKVPSKLGMYMYRGRFLIANDDKLMLVNESEAAIYDGAKWDRVF